MNTNHRRNIDTTDYTGRRIGNYRIQRLLGSGGMGSVYLGEHIVVGKKVAIKFLHKKFSDNAAHQVLFLREARATVAVDHVNVVDIHDFGISLFDDRYIVMEYLEGESVAELLERKGRLSLNAACYILIPTLRALCAAHNKGIVHRDLKPENIFLSYRKGMGPNVKLIDFGISTFLDKKDESGLIQEGKISGTLAYMPPEQLFGKEVSDCRTDLYAIGVILYQMLTGSLPFEGGSTSSFITNVLSKEPLPLPPECGDIPPRVVSLLKQLLSNDPAKRPANAYELLTRIISICDLSAVGTLRKEIALPLPRLLSTKNLPKRRRGKSLCGNHTQTEFDEDTTRKTLICATR